MEPEDDFEVKSMLNDLHGDTIHEKHEKVDSLLEEVHEQLRFLHGQIDS